MVGKIGRVRATRSGRAVGLKNADRLVDVGSRGQAPLRGMGQRPIRDDKKRGGAELEAELAGGGEDGFDITTGSGFVDGFEASVELGLGDAAALGVAMFEGVIEAANPELDAKSLVVDAKVIIELSLAVFIGAEIVAARKPFFTERFAERFSGR